MDNQHRAGGYDSLRINRDGQAEAFDAIGAHYDEAFPNKQGQVLAGDWLIRSLPTGLGFWIWAAVPACQLRASSWPPVSRSWGSICQAEW